MGTLSNLPWLRGLWSVDRNAAVSFRPARDAEIDPAIRLIACPSGQETQGNLKEFMRLATAHRQDAGGLWVAEQQGTILIAVLPVASPGRTMLLFVPPSIRSSLHEQCLKQLVEEICQRAAGEGVHLAQILLDDPHARVFAVLEECQFARLAELLYLQVAVPRNLRRPELPNGWRLENYSPAMHGLFGRTILASYQQSLDCPKLNGLRDIEDILAGHRATGEFDPKLWFILREGHEAIGVLLLSAVPQADLIELVYLGVPPVHRGRGVGDLLVRHAMAAVSASKYSRLSLAVDAGNLPALKVYWRHGLQAIGRKVALLRDLRQDAPQ